MEFRRCLFFIAFLSVFVSPAFSSNFSEVLYFGSFSNEYADTSVTPCCGSGQDLWYLKKYINHISYSFGTSQKVITDARIEGKIGEKDLASIGSFSIYTTRPDINKLLTSFTSTVDGVYYGSGWAGWERISGSNNIDYVFYFDDVNLSYANSLSSTKSLVFEYSSLDIFNFYLVSGRMWQGSGVVSLTFASAYIAPEMSWGIWGVVHGRYDFNSGSNFQVNLQYTDLGNYGTVSIDRLGNTVQVILSDSGGYEFYNSTSTESLNISVRAVDGVQIYLIDPSSGETIHRVLADIDVAELSCISYPQIDPGDQKIIGNRTFTYVRVNESVWFPGYFLDVLFEVDNVSYLSRWDDGISNNGNWGWGWESLVYPNWSVQVNFMFGDRSIRVDYCSTDLGVLPPPVPTPVPTPNPTPVFTPDPNDPWAGDGINNSFAPGYYSYIDGVVSGWGETLYNISGFVGTPIVSFTGHVNNLNQTLSGFSVSSYIVPLQIFTLFISALPESVFNLITLFFIFIVILVVMKV